MSEQQSGEVKSSLADVLRQRLESSKRSLGRIEQEGEKLVRRFVEIAERYVPESQRKRLEELAVEAVQFFGQIPGNVEENTRKVIEKLNLPTRKDLEDYNRKMRQQMEEIVRARLEKLKVLRAAEIEQIGKLIRQSLDDRLGKGLTRLKIATKADVEALSAELKNLKGVVEKLEKATAAKSKSSTKKVASKATA
jgi:preprotein translocase subunit SecA